MTKYKTVRLTKEQHKEIEFFKIHEDLDTIEGATAYLIKKGLECARGCGDVILEDVQQSTADLIKSLAGTGSGSAESVGAVTLQCIRYLRTHGTATHKDFMKSVYPNHELDLKPDSWWKCARDGLQQLEELGGPVQVPKGRGRSIYEWVE